MLSRLGSAVPQPITLAGVPGSEWDRLARPRTDAVWLMGVWTRSPAGRRIALAHPDLQHEYDRALPDVTPEDVVGSPYSIHAYVPDARFGGRAGLAAARGELARRGPLLHNNTAFPYLHGGCALDPGQCQRLRVLSRWLNEGVQIGTGLQHLPSRKGPPARG